MNRWLRMGGYWKGTLLWCYLQFSWMREWLWVTLKYKWQRGYTIFHLHFLWAGNREHGVYWSEVRQWSGCHCVRSRLKWHSVCRQAPAWDPARRPVSQRSSEILLWCMHDTYWPRTDTLASRSSEVKSKTPWIMSWWSREWRDYGWIRLRAWH